MRRRSHEQTLPVAAEVLEARALMSAFSFTHIADVASSTQPSISNGNIAFTAIDGVYLHSAAGVLDRVLTLPIGHPVGRTVSLDGTDIAFSTGDAVYALIEGSLHVIADTDTPIPSGSGTFESLLSIPSLSKGDVSFVGRGPDVWVGDPDNGFSQPQIGVYTSNAGELRRIADYPTTRPGDFDDGRQFGSFSNFVSVDDGSTAFVSRDFGAAGVYVEQSGLISVAADSNTLIPGTSEFFDRFAADFAPRGIAQSGGSTVFTGRSSDRTLGGIYVASGEGLRVIADHTTAGPNGVGSILPSLLSSNVSIDGQTVVFEAFSDSHSALYAFRDDTLQEIVASGHQLDGKDVAFVSISSEAVSGDSIAFVVQFVGGAHAIYRADFNDLPDQGGGDSSDDDPPPSGVPIPFPGLDRIRKQVPRILPQPPVPRIILPSGRPFGARGFMGGEDELARIVELLVAGESEQQLSALDPGSPPALQQDQFMWLSTATGQSERDRVFAALVESLTPDLDGL